MDGAPLNHTGLVRNGAPGRVPFAPNGRQMGADYLQFGIDCRPARGGINWMYWVKEVQPSQD